MKSSLLLIAGALGALLLPLLPHSEADASPAASPVPVAAAPTTYKIDGGHSSVVFKVKHMGAAWFYGSFDQISGQLVVDEEDPSKSSVKIEVAPKSVNTGSEKRNQHLKSPDFFDAKQFSELTFESKSVRRDGGTWKMQGTLNFHGVKKEIALEFEKTGAGPGRGGSKLIGFHSTFTIKRSDFGMDFMSDGLGDEVELIVSLEGVAR